MKTYQGADNAFGLNETASSPISRATYAPYSGEDAEGRRTFFRDGSGGGSMSSADKMKELGFPPYGSPESRSTSGPQGWANNPSYMRYGFQLSWDTYGMSCGDMTGMGMGMLNNIILSAVTWINMGTLVVIHYALDNVLYDFWGAMVQPFTGIFGAVFKPFMFIAAVVGAVYVFIKHKGRTQKWLGAVIWSASIIALAGTLTGQPGKVMQVANNFVTMGSGFAAEQMFTSGGMPNGACGSGERRYGFEIEGGSAQRVSENPYETLDNVWNAEDSTGAGFGSDQCILENLWYGVSYQTWANGMLSTDGGAQTRYGPALLNATYIGNDEAGREQLGNNEDWNSGSYKSIGADTKNHYWTADYQWNKSNYLAIIAAMCGNQNDAGAETDGGSDESNVWRSCKAGSAENTDEIDRVAYQALTGSDWKGRSIIALTGLFNATVVSITTAGVALYSIMKKFGFFFILMFAALFLAIAAWPGQRGKDFAKKYGEMLGSNIAKQAVAVILLLFVSYSFALIMAPNELTGLTLPDGGSTGTIGEALNIPYMLKPLMCLGMLAGLISFAMPLTKILKAAVDGDADRAGRVVTDMPKKAVKAAAVVTAAVATGGATAAAGGTSFATGLGKVASSNSAKQAVSSMYKMSRARTGMGKAAAAAQGIMGVKSSFTEDAADITASGEARSRSIYGLLNDTPGKFGLEEGVNYGNGSGGTTKPSKSAWAAAAAEHDSIQKEGAGVRSAAVVEARREEASNNIFTHHHAATGSYHPDDPKHPNSAQSKEEHRSHVRTRAMNEANSLLNVPEFGDSGVRTTYSADAAAMAERFNATTATEAAEAVPSAIQQVYSSAPARMDPTHAATGPILNAMYAPKDSTNRVELIQQAQEAVFEHGLPGMVNSVGNVNAPTGPQAAWRSSLVSVLPTLNAETTTRQRYDALKDMNVMAQTLPADSVVSNTFQNYRDALADPTQGPDRVNSLAQDVMRATMIMNVGEPGGGQTYEPGPTYRQSSPPEQRALNSGNGFGNGDRGPSGPPTPNDDPGNGSHGSDRLIRDAKDRQRRAQEDAERRRAESSGGLSSNRPSPEQRRRNYEETRKARESWRSGVSGLGTGERPNNGNGEDESTIITGPRDEESTEYFGTQRRRRPVNDMFSDYIPPSDDDIPPPDEDR